MHIFVDESGTFIPQTSGQNSVSAVGALVIPSASLSGFEKLYGRLRRKLPKIGGEVKGRLLSEAEVGEVVTLLKKVGSIFEIVAIDSAHHTPEILEKHRMRQAEAVTHHLTDEFHPDVVKAIWALRTQLEDLSLQLYVQSIAMVMLVYHTIYHTNLYFSLRTGAELGSYHWVIDAKERDKVTPWEEWWSTVILPWIESKSFREPFAAVEGG